MKTVTMVYAGDLKEIADAIFNTIPSITYFSYDKELARLTMDTDNFVTVSKVVAQLSERHFTWTVA
jgi:hypothetical protein